MKIAVLRGPFLNPWEAQTWYPLIDMGHDIIFIGSSNIQSPVVHLVPNKTLTTFIKVGKYRTYLSPKLGRILRDCDIVHSVETYHLFTLQAASLKKRYNFKFYVTQWENIAYPFNIRGGLIRNTVKNKVDKIIAVTKKSRDALLEENTDINKIVIIPPGIDLTKFKRYTSPVRNNINCDLVVLFIGRLVEGKGVLDLLKAMEQIWNKYKNVKLVICGRGPLKHFVLSYLKRGYPILYYESYPYNKICDLYNACDVFILPSKSMRGWKEQFGMVLIEAMACERAVLTTNSGSIPYVVDKFAQIVEAGNVKQIQESLALLLEDDKLRRKFGKKSRKFVEKNYDNRLVARKLLKLYKS